MKIKGFKENIYKLSFILSKKQKALGLGLFLLATINAFLQMIGVYILTPLVAAMNNADSFMTTRLARIIQGVFYAKDFHRVFVLLCIVIAIIYAIKELFSLFFLWYSLKYAQLVQRELSEKVLKCYLAMDYDFFVGYGTSKIMRDVREDTETVNRLLTFISYFLTETLSVVLIVAFIVATDVKLALVTCLLALFCVFVAFLPLKRTMVVNGDLSRKARAENQKVLLETVEGIKEVQVMKKELFFLRQYRQSFRKTQRPELISTLGGTAPTYIIEGVFVIGIVLYLGISSAYVNSFFDKIPVLAGFFAAAIRLLPSMGRISNSINNINFCLPALNSVYNNISFANKSVGIVDKAEVNQDQLKLNDKISLKNIYWKYSDGDRYVLNDLSLEIKKGDSIGIIGQSGAGKSTLVDIILGLHVPSNGVVFLDNKDIHTIPYEYSSIIGYVPQSIYLIDGTIRENVAFGVANEEIDDELVWESLKLSMLEDYVLTESTLGLDTIVGERGVKFSGGQRQRLAIARALYRKPQILVLDEATSALDVETEAEVIKSLEALYGRMTIIIIAHRLTTVMKCDRIVEIVDGKAVEKNKQDIFDK